MNTAQNRILGQIEKLLTDAGYSVAQDADWANTGRVLVYSTAASPVAIATIYYGFQGGSYTLSITWRGQRIPSQEGRADYFDFYQDYDKPTRFWEALRLVATGSPA